MSICADRTGKAEPAVAAPAVVHVRSAAALARIGEPGVELALWKRILPSALGGWLDALPDRQLPSVEVTLPPAEMAVALRSRFDSHGTPAAEPRELLIADIARLVSRFAALLELASVDLRLAVVRDDSCRKFHRDCVRARLLTTYRGPATQWVLPAHGAAALADPVDFSGPIEHFPLQAVGVFRGCGEHDHRGIVHRSPPIAASGAIRLLLCLNEPNWSGSRQHHERATVGVALPLRPAARSGSAVDVDSSAECDPAPAPADAAAHGAT